MIMQKQSHRLLIVFALVSAPALSINANGQATSPHCALPSLPQPSGTFGVGRVAFDWIDPNRSADMTDDRGPHAELMVYVWYPTEAPSKEVHGILFPGAREIDSASGVSNSLKAKLFGGNWPLVVSGVITSHAENSAPIAKKSKTFPVVLFSPGAFGASFQYSSAIEDLVSHGYIVAAIEHTSEVFGVIFRDRKVHVYSPARIPKQAMPPPGSTKEEYEIKLEEWYRHNVDVRAADISFVLDKVTELNRSSSAFSQFSRRLDLDHVGVIGHSRGGWAAIVACRRDERLRACVNEDGNAGGQGLQYPGAPLPKQPILYIEVSPVLKPGTSEDDWIVLKQLHLTAEEWVRQWHEMVNEEFRMFPAGGYFVELSTPDLEHYSFSDELYLQAAREGVKEKEEVALRNLHLTQNISRTFLDETLKSDKAAALQGSPQVTVHRFGSRN
jgi:dienelactone hydrolase